MNKNGRISGLVIEPSEEKRYSQEPMLPVNISGAYNGGSIGRMLTMGDQGNEDGLKTPINELKRRHIYNSATHVESSPNQIFTEKHSPASRASQYAKMGLIGFSNKKPRHFMRYKAMAGSKEMTLDDLKDLQHEMDNLNSFQQFVTSK